MKQYELANGDRIPALGLGTWKSAPGEVGPAVREALRLGYRHIDCAAIYDNEPEIGAVLVDALRAGSVRRDELWITSKLWNDAHLPQHVRPALEKTLGDLRLDFLDLYLIHWPVALKPGVFVPERAEDFVSPEEAPLADTWQALEDCARAGLCRHIGVSNFSAGKLAALIAGASIRPEVNQVEMHPYLPQRELLAWCRERGVLVTAYAPLGSGDRPDMLKKNDEPDLLDNPVIGEIAERIGATPAQVLIRWAIQRGTNVIPKSVDPRRLAENLAAVELELPDDEMQRIDGLEGPYRFLDGDFWAIDGSPYSVAGLWDD